MGRIVSERIERGSRPFKGLSDKSRPDALTVGECCELINSDFFEDGAKRRGGTVRIAGPLRNGSTRLDGRNDHLVIKNQAGYQPTNSNFYFGIGLVLRRRPAAAVTLVSWGFGAAGNLFFDIRYDPAAGTGALGAWVLRVRDATAGATRTLTLDDGDGTTRPVGAYRFIEFSAALLDFGFRMWDESGNATSVSFGGGIAAFNWTAAQDIYLGVGTTALNTIGTDFIDATICEPRLGASLAGGPASFDFYPTTANKYYIRELPASHAAALDGYWKLNDGDDAGIKRDFVGTNHALIPNNPPPWERQSDNVRVLGQSAVRFKGGNQFIDLRDTTSGTTTIASVFTVAAGNCAHWTVRIIYEPEMPPGATAVPNGTILWMGADAAIPAPVAIRVVSDRLQFDYRDGGVTATMTAGAPVPTMSSLVGKRLRISVLRTGSVNGSWGYQIAIDDGNPLVFGTNFFTNLTACGALNPGVTSQDLAIGNHVTNFASSRLGTMVFGASGALWGMVDDFQIVSTDANSGLVFVGVGGIFQTGLPYGPFAEVDNWNASTSGGVHRIACYLKLNEGAGTGPLSVLGFQPVTNGGWQAYLRPLADSGCSSDVGLVDPQEPVRATLFRAYDRFVNDRKTRREAIVFAGTTAYALNVLTADLRIIGALPAAADAWTSAQYGQRFLAAGAPGRRPIWTNGDGVFGLGIEPPEAAAIPTFGTTGSFTAGSYYLYVRFRNRDTGEESNPGPGTLITFVAPDDQIATLTIPVSSDSQVNQRRVFMTALGGADGDVAYLVAEINDNTTTVYSTTIDSVSTSSEAMTDYFGQAAAPKGTIIAQFKDYTLVGGSQEFPTRLYFSQPGVPGYWLPDDGLLGGDYKDLDLDSGRPITAITSLINSAAVDFSDGRAVLTTTGDPDDPLAFQFTERSSGAVGPQAIVGVGNTAYFIGEDGIWFTNGFDQSNLSGPGERTLDAPKFLQEAERPSISRTMLRKVRGENRRRFVATRNRSKSQIVFAVNLSASASSNDTLLIFDTERRVWSKWDVSLDCGDQIDDENGSASLWGVSGGYICKLDVEDQLADGFSGVTAVGTVSSVSGKTITVSGALGPVSELRFQRCYVLIAATGQAAEFTLRDNPDATTLIAADDADLTGIANGDVFIVGGIQSYLELVFRFGSALDKKRMKWLRFYGESTVDPLYLRVAYKLDENRYDQSIAGWANEIRQWPVGTSALEINIGGIGGLLRVRIGEQALATGTPTMWMPSVGAIKISAIEAIAEMIAAL
jgi:hypothetical protein